jgi:hypothetical protein
MHRIYFLILTTTALVALFLFCEEEKMAVNTQPFAIESIDIPEVLSSLSYQPVLVTAKVSHPEGSSGIQSVDLEILDASGNTVKNLEMFDDGGKNHPKISGDVIAFDQVYSRLIVPHQDSLNLPDGNYSAEVKVTAVGGTAIESTTQTLEIFPNQPPAVVSFSFPDSIDKGMQPRTISITVNDNDGLADVLWGLIEGYKAGSTSLAFRDTLYNPMNNSSVFSKTIDSSYAVGKKGVYEINFLAEDRVGALSNPDTQSVYFENSPPLTWDSQVPDTLQRPLTGANPIAALITLRVKDNQSLSDIDEVYFYSLKPDSTFANNGNPFDMWDNGLPFTGDPSQLQYAGDLVAGDGIYSFTVVLFDNALLGKYTFSFYAKDKAGQLSTVLIDSVQVVQ